MAGTHITISAEGGDAIQRALSRLLKRGQSLAPALTDIGAMLELSHRERWGLAPDGTPWQPLSPTTQQLKPRHKENPLRLNDLLRDTLAYQVQSDTLRFGSNLVYAALHQLGGTTSARSMIPGKTIPARPFLGLSPKDRDASTDILAHYLQNALNP
ncbi:phage virion morphogenesis protein [Ferrimonas balearica]|uniref:phage virion morphogenesis protein n=1 Tax=Ferrimonas balearica TaxID=44012 RepID=UPI001C98028D|nr:phage virion morphogenesis protein [Ferrimonas balearica]MBY6223569.1 phage virion morphogenesis protein [Ferrimonas balearica]